MRVKTWLLVRWFTHSERAESYYGMAGSRQPLRDVCKLPRRVQTDETAMGCKDHHTGPDPLDMMAREQLGFWTRSGVTAGLDLIVCGLRMI